MSTKLLCGWAALPCAVAIAGCGSEGVESLQGAWSGSIACLTETSELSLGLLVEGGKIRGSGQIRTKGSNADYEASGAQTEVERLVECMDPTCATDSDCAGKLDKNGASGKSRCAAPLCAPCYEKQKWPQVTIALRDNNVAIPDPTLVLLRYGVARMEGTIKSFCPDEAQQAPMVKVEKAK
jgi:hypothetical protein